MGPAFHSPVAAEYSVFANHHDLALQLDIGAGRTDHDLEFTGLDRPLVVLVGEIQHIDRHGKIHDGFLPGPERHPLKGLELLDGANEGSVDIAYVHLDYFATFTLARILECERKRDGAIIDVDLILLDRKRAVFKPGIAQTIAETIFASEVIGDGRAGTLELVVVVIGHRADAFGDRNHQAAAWRDLTRQQIGDGRCPFLSRLESHQNCCRPVFQTVQSVRSARSDYDDGGRARGEDLLQKLLLHSRELKAIRVRAFADRAGLEQAGQVADKDDSDVGFARTGNGLRDLRNISADGRNTL